MPLLLDSMKHFQALAELLASYHHPKAMIRGINGLTEIVRTGHLHSKEKFFSRENEHCEQLVTVAQIDLFALLRIPNFYINN